VSKMGAEFIRQAEAASLDNAAEVARLRDEVARASKEHALLIRIGDHWIRSEDVRAAYPFTPIFASQGGWSVVVQYQEGKAFDIPCKTEDEARKLADDIAARVNAATAPPGTEADLWPGMDADRAMRTLRKLIGADRLTFEGIAAAPDLRAEVERLRDVIRRAAELLDEGDPAKILEPIAASLAYAGDEAAAADLRAVAITIDRAKALLNRGR
jgi:hypothetical protein